MRALIDNRQGWKFGRTRKSRGNTCCSPKLPLVDESGARVNYRAIIDRGVARRVLGCPRPHSCCKLFFKENNLRQVAKTTRQSGKHPYFETV